MRKLLMVMMLFGPGLVACGETDTDEPGVMAPADATMFTLTPEGGTFRGEGPLAGVELVVPAGAVDEAVDLWMALPTEERPLPDTGQMVGPEVEFGPVEVALSASAALTLPFVPEEVEAVGSDVLLVKVWRVGPSGWTLEEPLDTASGDAVVAEVDTLTRFGAGVELD